MSEKTIKQYLAEIGKRGGSVKGKTKRRGGSAHYKELAAKAAAARKAKAAGKPK